ncbi:MAG TPA: amidase [Solirubrobacteraceae bacterium]|nr:amidase [Solirubrobacteraceae bacterium]
MTASGRPTDLAQLGVLAAAELLRARRVSSVELVGALQAQIERVNGGPPTEYGSTGAINAWVRLYPELAQEQARAADRRLAAEGDGAPLLCGVPIGLKDLYAAEGLPLTASSRVLEGYVADADCTAWARLRASGMVLMGHLHTHEFACGGTCDQVGNPWRTELTASGSSGGSAAAVAAGMVPVATGTDTAGSIRAPAAICGVSGIKPTTGRIPLDGVIPLGATFDTLGPLARSVADCSAVLAAMAGGRPATVAHSVPAGTLGELPLRPRGGARPLAGCTVAITDRFARLELDPDVRAGYERAQAAVRALGGRLVELPAPVGAFTLQSPEFALVLVEMWAYHERLFAEREELYRPQLRATLRGARDAMPASEYARRQLRRAECARNWEEWFDAHRVDVILEPATRVVAYPRGDGYHYTDVNPLADLTLGWNVTGHPGVALPCGLGPASGLPTGIQLIARRGRETEAIQVGIDLQEHELPPLPLAWSVSGPVGARSPGA